MRRSSLVPAPKWLCRPDVGLNCRLFPFRPQKWTEEPQWLDVPSNELVASFTDNVQTNTFAGVHFEFNLPPPLTVPAVNQESPFDTNSTLQVVGEVARRDMLGQMNLPLWPYADVIAPSVVQVLVDAAGNVVSAVLLSPENFSEQSPVRNPDADQFAVRLARTARFAPLAPDAASLSSDSAGVKHLAVGRLVFNWANRAGHRNQCTGANASSAATLIVIYVAGLLGALCVLGIYSGDAAAALWAGAFAGPHFPLQELRVRLHRRS